MSSISHDLTSHISALSHLNSQITNSQEAGENAWASERAHDVRQDKEITALYSAVRDFKEKLFQVSLTCKLIQVSFTCKLIQVSLTRKLFQAMLSHL